MKPYLIALAATAFAANVIVASPALGADSALLPMQEIKGNISYVSGGVGEDEAAAMKRVRWNSDRLLMDIAAIQPYAAPDGKKG